MNFNQSKPTQTAIIRALANTNFGATIVDIMKATQLKDLRNTWRVLQELRNKNLIELDLESMKKSPSIQRGRKYRITSAGHQYLTERALKNRQALSQFINSGSTKGMTNGQ